MLGIPQDWILIGEGAANAVYTYTGEQNDLARTPTVVPLHSVPAHSMHAVHVPNIRRGGRR